MVGHLGYDPWVKGSKPFLLGGEVSPWCATRIRELSRAFANGAPTVAPRSPSKEPRYAKDYALVAALVAALEGDTGGGFGLVCVPRPLGFLLLLLFACDRTAALL